MPLMESKDVVYHRYGAMEMIASLKDILNSMLIMDGCHPYLTVHLFRVQSILVIKLKSILDI